jgi:hypothetical protein
MKVRNQGWRLAGTAAMSAGAMFLYACTDTGPTNVAPEVDPNFLIPPGGEGGHDLNNFGLSPANVDGALWIFPAPANVGTGNIDPFLSIQADPDEEGFNTDGTLPFDSKRPNFTDALPLNKIPIIKFEGANYREIIFDANESNSFPDAQFSIDRFDLYICLDEDGTTIPDVETVAGFADNPDCELIYSPFDPDTGHRGFATDAATQGSGQALDYDILIPEDLFDAFDVGQVTVDDCPYNPLLDADGDGTPGEVPDDGCGLWVVLHAEMGHFGGEWVTGATFDEFSTVLQPFVTIEKTAVPEFTRTYTWEIEKSVDPTNIYLFDGQSEDATWTVVVNQTGSEDSDWQVTGQVTIVNPSDEDATVTSVTDLLQPGNIPITLSCVDEDADNSAPWTLDGGEELTCTYTHTFGADPGGTEFTNTVEVELDGLAVTTGESESFSFTTPTTEVNKTVDVEDLLEGLLAEGIDTGDTFEYTIQYTCDEDEGTEINVAQVIGDGDEVLDEDGASLTVHCLDLEVTKNAETALERTYLWEIEKTVTPATWDLFNGDEGTSDYDVTVTPNGVTDAEFSVSGEIHVHNPNSVAVYIQGEPTDALTGGINATVENCEVDAVPVAAYPYTLAAGKTIDCEYSTSVPDDSDRTNTATATAKPTAAGESKDFTGDADVDFDDPVLTEVNKVINVTDTFEGDLGARDWDDGAHTFEYSRTFECDDDEGTHDNTATIVETDQSDDASVTVNCHALVVTKDAETRLTRTWDWDVSKVGEVTELELMPGQTFNVDYTVTATVNSFTDSDHGVSGDIHVSNAGNPIAATINSVSDVIEAGGINGNAACGVTFPYTLAAGATLDCTYDAELPNDDDRENTATATRQAYSYSSAGVATENGTVDYSGSADVDFPPDASNIEHVDECVDVDDTLGGALGTACVDPEAALPQSFDFDYDYDVTAPEGVCEDFVVDNTATITTNDQDLEESDDWSIPVTVPCPEGCTLTIGYWKTHNESFEGGAPVDETWELLGDIDGDGIEEAEGEEFFDTGMSWFEVFWTAPQGNAYYNLAHQYMGAYLNILNGADPSAVSAAMASAETLFNTYSIATVGGWRGNQGARQQFISLAGTLADYNEGDIGPGHCDEDESSAPT